MDDMARQTHLVQRGTRWYFRCAIPSDIKDTYSKTEEKWSLGTSDYNEAVKMVRTASAEAERKFEAHRQLLKAQAQPARKELSQEEIRKVGQVYYAHLLKEDEETRLAGFYKGEELENPAKTFEEHLEDTEATDEGDRYYNARGEVFKKFYLDEAEEVLSWSGLRLESQSPSLMAVARELQAASIKATKAIRERNQGEVVETPSEEGLTSHSLVPPLSQARDEWFKVKAREGSWSNPRTKDQYRTWTDRFLAIVGDYPINQYSKADGRKFRDVISSLPKNMEKYKALKGLSIESVPKKAKALSLETMSRANVNKYIVGVSALWKWIESNYDEEPPNPLKGMEYKIKSNPRKERDPFT
ncbi:MAG: integrase, partial [Candidatus Bathyarchaeota archaeon]|nr:integrase [Candidatus Bathyarchaeota archaeon]